MLRSASLLLILSAAAAQSQTLTLSACNAGTVDVDVYFAQGSNPVTKHIASADCATLLETKGPMAPGLVAVAFADSRGQWGAVHRMEGLARFSLTAAERTTQTVSVNRGASRTPIPAQFYFKPPTPVCITTRYSTPNSIIVRETIRCDDFKYTLNVLAFPEGNRDQFAVDLRANGHRVEGPGGADAVEIDRHIGRARINGQNRDGVNLLAARGRKPLPLALLDLLLLCLRRPIVV